MYDEGASQPAHQITWLGRSGGSGLQGAREQSTLDSQVGRAHGEFDGSRGHLSEWLPHAAHRRCVQTDEEGVIEADHGHRAREPVSHGTQLLDGADGNEVVGAEQCIGVWPALEGLDGGGAAPVQ